MSPTKNKIYMAVFFWLLGSGIMFGYLFKKIDSSNQTLIQEMSGLKRQEANLEAEKKSFIEAQNDLGQIENEKLKPEQFFSQDVTLVNEIRRLESIARDIGIEMELSGISGTLKNATKAGAKSEIFQIPYIISLKGPLSKVVAFMEYMENLEFITKTGQVNLSAAGKGEVNVTFNSFLYLKK